MVIELKTKKWVTLEKLESIIRSRRQIISPQTMTLKYTKTKSKQ